MDKIKQALGYFTPFNIVLASIIVATFYAGYLAIWNWSTLRQLDQAAPGHRVTVSKTPVDLTVTMFYDYRCTFCYQIDPIIRAAAEQDGRVELLFKFLPSLGEESEYMARIAFAGGQQGKFLEVHDYIIEGGNRTYDESEIDTMCESLELDCERFKRDLESNAAKSKVKDNMDLALSLGAYSTPTLIIGNEFFIPTGQMPTEIEFQEMFQQARQNL